MEMVNVNEHFACPEVTRDGGFWIETPLTAAATVALLQAFAVSRMEDPGWQPIWCLCGARGAGLTALAARFATQVRNIATCDSRWRFSEDTSEASKNAQPEIVRESKCIWNRYQTELTAADDLVRFRTCRNAARSTWYGSGSESKAIPGVDDAEPVVLVRMNHQKRRGHQTHGYAHSAWSHQANQVGDNPRRTSMAILDDVEHLVRFSEAKRIQALEEMLDWPDVIHLGHRVTLVLIGTPALADAVATCKPVRRIELLRMEEDETFAKVCSLVFGDGMSGRLSQLHKQSEGLIGRLLHIAHLEGLWEPYTCAKDR